MIGGGFSVGMIVIGIILSGMIVGAAAQLVIRRSARGLDWFMAFVSGIVGSFVGGLLFSLLAGHGLALRPSGFVGSFIGALIVTAVWQWFRRRAGASQ
ncbi:MAG: GlsB/YeaQ/YmgE family stress response membrane protein [Propioniciclava sp.]